MSTPETHKVTNLILVRDGGRVLLAMKKRGFGAGRWNGFGGKVKPPETVEQAAVRETQEEGSITPVNLKKCGLLHFDFAGDPLTIECHVYTTDAWTGEPAETEEMAPRWFPIDGIPFAEMWPDDVHWFPLFLAGQNFEAWFTFAQDQKTIVSQKIVETD